MRKRDKEVRIRLSNEEYVKLQKNAEKANMKVAPYVRKVAQSPNIFIVNCDYNIIAEHTKEIAKVRTAINQMIFTIEATNNYLPKDIETIVELITYIFKTENELLYHLRRERNLNFEKLID